MKENKTELAMAQKARFNWGDKGGIHEKVTHSSQQVPKKMTIIENAGNVMSKITSPPSWEDFSGGKEKTRT